MYFVPKAGPWPGSRLAAIIQILAILEPATEVLWYHDGSKATSPDFTTYVIGVPKPPYLLKVSLKPLRTDRSGSMA